MSNLYDTANQLEKEIRETEAFKALEAAHKAVASDKEANELFQEFQTVQLNLQQKQMQGEEFTPEDGEKAQAISQKIQDSDLIKTLMTKEQEFSVIINDLNRIIMEPIRGLYEGTQEK